MDIPMKYEDVVAKLETERARVTDYISQRAQTELRLEAALGREAALREELLELSRKLDVFYSRSHGIKNLSAIEEANDKAEALQQRLAVAEQRAAMLERELKKLRDIAHDCYQIASSYSGCIDGVEEHGGDDHEDPSCAIYHRLYYAMFDADRALKPAAEGEGS